MAGQPGSPLHRSSSFKSAGIPAQGPFVVSPSSQARSFDATKMYQHSVTALRAYIQFRRRKFGLAGETRASCGASNRGGLCPSGALSAHANLSEMGSLGFDWCLPRTESATAHGDPDKVSHLRLCFTMRNAHAGSPACSPMTSRQQPRSSLLPRPGHTKPKVSLRFPAAGKPCSCCQSLPLGRRHPLQSNKHQGSIRRSWRLGCRGCPSLAARPLTARRTSTPLPQRPLRSVLPNYFWFAQP
ncbi:hypothetical protein N657DRAFT_150402 [Parathielavia appendiculata]|uniref:Uncharacterized protein n=1 Tax=Parathielavia appendiculata TaxID=2587402 RepID=A0AAN6Z1K2_9PEZI|nr:hypothetical protein N657DRAFT_150402 [Parathielavia appendiculata]